MSIPNNSNVSFKANFQFAEQTYHNLPEKELKNALRKPAKAGKEILDFMSYIYSNEGREQLAKLPKNDIVELSLFENDNGQTKAYLDPYFYYYSPSMPNRQRVGLECNDLVGQSSTTQDLKETFIKWSNKLAEAINQYKQ